MPNVIMGVDPAWAKKHAVAIVDFELGHITTAKLDLRDISPFILAHGVEEVVIEDQYLNKNYATAKKLSWSAGEIIGLAKIHGKPFHMINVSQWKASMLSKRLPIDVVDEMFSLKMSDDEACALLIAMYYAKSINIINDSVFEYH